MKNVLINNELELSYPDHYEVLTEETLRKVYGNNIANRWVIRDPQRGILISVFWEKVGGLFGKAVGYSVGAAMNDETKMKKKLAGKGYLFHTTYSMKIGKNNATGYRYEYDGVSGNRMWGEGVFFKVNSNGYRIYYSSTKKEVPTGTQDFDTFLNNIMVL